MQTFLYVEDYLEYLAGYDPTNQYILLGAPEIERFKLARYDVSVINNMSTATIFGDSLTEAQAELAVNLVTKYKKQFSKKGIDISPITKPVYRRPLRTVDNSKSLMMHDGKLIMRFPFDKNLIDEIKQQKEVSQGSMTWDRSDRFWTIAPTEQNILWSVHFSKRNSFEVSDDVMRLHQSIMSELKKDYHIRLRKRSNRYEIVNAEKNLVKFIEENHGGFGLNNCSKLVELSGYLGYSVDDDILSGFPKSIRHLAQRYSVHLQPSKENLDMVFDYAEQMQRYPICIYNPTLIDIDLGRFNEEDIVYFNSKGKTDTVDYNPYTVKCVYAKKIPMTWDFPVPLLVTTFEMIYGGLKSSWTSKAEKIIYLTEALMRKREQ
jgi:hypothetical protein